MQKIVILPRAGFLERTQMKTKCEIISKAKYTNWVKTSNVFAKSEIKSTEALKQYKALTVGERIAIKKEMTLRDEIRKNRSVEPMDTFAFELSVLVDMNIIATEYDIDPLTVAMCINPPCKISSNVFVK